ncbi:hypothetical protein [Mycoplana dimorpha]|uniref:Deacetylase sirtuin-type domain-containing protein n=1 Tax=Mycoplana dimorpha TaxID=28320 RepID=A0A2T5B645_MYCDI|nr:hypothetical protein [Mycoplana dimorpha]PTM94466.1 hypothetical protein C7449_105370 [Mycoplana dimorpha]
MDFIPSCLVVAGAGFSFNAGLPLASTFSKALLNVNKLKLDGPSANHVRFLRNFVNQVFGEGEDIRPEEWPELEDLFTLVDLSANTGHHLGMNYSASDLRVVRRAIIVRMIRMLPQAYRRKMLSKDAQWRTLETFFERFDTQNTAVLSMNWDTVFESGIARTQSVRAVDYGCDARACEFERSALVKAKYPEDRALRLLKPHGSVNWLYCDSCRELFWLPASQTEKVAQTLFRDKDWKSVIDFTGSRTKATVLTPRCIHCRSTALGTRFATFSYRKALDFPMHAATWRTAERYLKKAGHWVFFGYSMPAADFEFKYLLKRVQLSEPIRPAITVITGGSDAKDTIERYEKFFGTVSGERYYFANGLTSHVLQHLNSIGVLRHI